MNALKKITYCLLLIVLFSCTNEKNVYENEHYSGNHSRSVMNTRYYWALGEKRILHVDSSQYFVVLNFESACADNDKKELLRIDSGDFYPLEYSDDLFNKISSPKPSFVKGILQKNDLINPNLIQYKSCFYTDSQGRRVGVGDEILVKLKEPDSEALLLEYMSKFQLKLIDRLDTEWYVLQCESNRYGSSLDIANIMYESGHFEEAYPNLLVQLEKCTIDGYYDEQWGLENNEYPGVDIDYIHAMEHPFPYFNAVTVAVVDDGISTTHPELNLSTYGYNAHLGQEVISVSPGTHGTMVAGIIGAKSNNYIGIAGVCPNVKLMSISVKFRQDYPDYYTSSISIAKAIIKAYENGASIINCSFDATQVDPLVLNIYNDAMSVGRAGRGCIVVFGAGNENDEITNAYAINLPNAIVVGGINNNGNKSIYSAYGEYLDIVAPGSGIWSTNVNGGYSYASGTSFAAPYVSGVAALILAKNPTLTREQVVDIIYSSAKKLSGYSFSNYSNRDYSWNQYVGYGLVDANAALNITPAP